MCKVRTKEHSEDEQNDQARHRACNTPRWFSRTNNIDPWRVDIDSRCFVVRHHYHHHDHLTHCRQVVFNTMEKPTARRRSADAKCRTRTICAPCARVFSNPCFLGPVCCIVRAAPRDGMGGKGKGKTDMHHFRHPIQIRPRARCQFRKSTASCLLSHPPLPPCWMDCAPDRERSRTQRLDIERCVI